MDTANFLSAVLPASGQRCVGLLKGKAFQNLFGPDNAWAANAAQKIDQRGVESYFACASFVSAGSRQAANVAYVRSFWVDIDTQEGKPSVKYADRKTAVIELLRFCKEVGLDQPMVVSSGYGVHAYWRCDADMDAATWKATASLLKEATRAWGLDADPSRTADAASVLRPVGTSNHKHGTTRPVKLLTAGEITTQAEVMSALSDYLRDHNAIAPRTYTRPTPGPSLNQDLIAVEEYPPSSGIKIAEGCGVVARMRDTRGNIDQPTWYGVLGVLAHTVEGDSLCHEWSDGHKDYSVAETKAKIDQARGFGPTTCAKLRDGNETICQSCPHFGNIKSPIVLGFTEQDLDKSDLSKLDLSAFDVSNLWHDIPRRDWIMPPILIAGHYSMLAATGASGKSALAITLALALTTGRSDLLDMPVDRPCKVIIFNGEDGQEELMRRVRATCQLFGIELADIARRLLVVGARQVPGLTFNRAVQGGVSADEAGLSRLEGIIQSFAADVVIIDPLGSFMPGGMNDGASASAVAGRLTDICVKAKAAMLLVHHVSKAAMRDGDNDPTAALGSAMWANHARSVWNARRPSLAEAQEVGIPPSRVKDLLLLLHSKANLSRAADATFIELTGVELPNAQPPKYPRGDVIGVARRLALGSLQDLFRPATVKAVLDQIANGTAAGAPYKASGRSGAQDFKPDVATILHTDFPNETPDAREKLAVQLVSTLRSDGRLVTASLAMPRAGSGKGGGKVAEGLLVNWAATDWAANPGIGRYAVSTGAPQGTSG